MSVVNDLQIYGNVYSSSTTDSTSTSTGSFIINGGIGIAKSLFIGKTFNTTDLTNATSPTTGSITTSGGISSQKNIWCLGKIVTDNTTASTSATTGSLITAGGVGIGGDLNTSGIVKVLNTTQATSTSTGSLIVSGGVGVAMNMHIGGNLTVSGTTTTINSIDSTITDKFLGLGKGNTADVSDLGIWMRYDDGVAKYAGLFRDNSVLGKPFTFFENSTDDFEGGVNAVNTFTLSNVKLGGLSASGLITSLNTTDSTAANTGSVQTKGGLYVEKTIWGAGPIKTSDTTQSTDKDTGALVIEGGAGIEKNLFVGGNLTVLGIISGTSATDGFDAIVVQDNGTGAPEFDGTGNYNVGSNTQRYIYCNNTPAQGQVTVTLPSISVSGKFVFIAKLGTTNAFASNVVITRGGSDFIEDGISTTVTLKRQYERITLISYKPVSGSSVWLIQ